MNRVYVNAVGIFGPGLDGWTASQPILSGQHRYERTPTQIPLPSLLPPNERRRSVQTVRLSLAAGSDAFANTESDPGSVATIFTSSGGDGSTIHDILLTLASQTREISPTKFHNSVHNAPAGYWGIATGSQAPSSSICAHDGSFAAGLLEAFVYVGVEGKDAVLIAYDAQYPPPLEAVRAIDAPFAVALILSSAQSPTTLASLEIMVSSAGPVATMANAELELVRKGIPAARCLPLLTALAAGIPSEVHLPYLDGTSLSVITIPAAKRDEVG